MPDLGNPNYFKVFKGRYEINARKPSVTRPYVMLSCVNDVQFMCDFTADADGVIAILPYACTPERDVFLPCRVEMPQNSKAVESKGITAIECGVKTGEIAIDTFSISKKVALYPDVSNGFTAEQYDNISSSEDYLITSKNRTPVKVPIVENRTFTIEIPEQVAPSAHDIGYVTVTHNGVVKGKPLAKCYLNGLSFHISDRFYIEKTEKGGGE